MDGLDLVEIGLLDSAQTLEEVLLRQWLHPEPGHAVNGFLIRWPEIEWSRVANCWRSLLKIVVEDAHGATLWLRQVRDNFTTLGIATGIAVAVDLEQLGWIGWVENFDLFKVGHFHITMSL